MSFASEVELANVNPSEVIFREELFRSQYSLVYLVTIRGTTCVMKLVGLSLRMKLADLLNTSIFSNDL